MRIKTEIFTRQHLRGKNDLAGVLREVFHHVVHGGNARHLIFLNRVFARESRGIERGDDSGRFFDGASKMREKVLSGMAGARSELLVTFSQIRRAAETRDDPLPNVAGEVQREIANRIFVFAAAGPDLVLREASEAGFDSRRELAQRFHGSFGPALRGGRVPVS